MASEAIGGGPSYGMISAVRWVELEQDERKARIARVVRKRAAFMGSNG